MPKNAQTTAQLHSSHTLVKLKILQARLHQYMNRELPVVQAGFRKGRGTRDQMTLESPLDCKEIQPIHSKGDQYLVFFGRNDAKAETPILWPPHAKS